MSEERRLASESLPSALNIDGAEHPPHPPPPIRILMVFKGLFSCPHSPRDCLLSLMVRSQLAACCH